MGVTTVLKLRWTKLVTMTMLTKVTMMTTMTMIITMTTMTMMITMNAMTHRESNGKGKDYEEKRWTSQKCHQKPGSMHFP